MNLIVFPVKFNKFRLKITANTGKYFLQVVRNDLCEDAIAILCNKDQMGMKKEYAVSSGVKSGLVCKIAFRGQRVMAA